MVSLRSPKTTDMVPSEIPLLAPKIVNVEPEFIGLYLDHYYKIDPWTELESSMEYASVLRFSDLLPYQELAQSIFYREYLFPQKIEDGYAVMLAHGENKHVILNLLIDSSPEMNPALIKEFLSILAPHLQRAFSIAMELSLLKSENILLSALLDNRREGLVLLTDNLEIQYLNSYAKKVIDENNEISSQGDVFRIRDKATQEKLLRIIAMSGSCEDRQNRYMVVARQQNSPPLQLHVAPFTHGLDDSHHVNASLMLLISDPDNSNYVNANRLTSLFSLTPAEVKLTKSLVTGTTLSEYSSAQGISLNTVRWHLRNVFEKVEASSQQELIVKILSI